MHAMQNCIYVHDIRFVLGFEKKIFYYEILVYMIKITISSQKSWFGTSSYQLLFQLGCISLYIGTGIICLTKKISTYVC